MRPTWSSWREKVGAVSDRINKKISKDLIAMAMAKLRKAICFSSLLFFLRGRGTRERQIWGAVEVFVCWIWSRQESVYIEKKGKSYNDSGI